MPGSPLFKEKKANVNLISLRGPCLYLVILLSSYITHHDPNSFNDFSNDFTMGEHYEKLI